MYGNARLSGTARCFSLTSAWLDPPGMIFLAKNRICGSNEWFQSGKIRFLEPRRLWLLTNGRISYQMAHQSWPLTQLLLITLYIAWKSAMCQGLRFMAINVLNDWPFDTNSPVSLSWGCLVCSCVLKFPSGPLRYYTQVSGMGMRSRCRPKKKKSSQYWRGDSVWWLGITLNCFQTTPRTPGWGLNLIRTLRGVPEIVFTRTVVLDRL